MKISICPYCSSSNIFIAGIYGAKVKNYNYPHDTIELPLEEGYYCNDCESFFMTYEQATSVSLGAKLLSKNIRFEPVVKWSDIQKGVLKHEFV